MSHNNKQSRIADFAPGNGVLRESNNSNSTGWLAQSAVSGEWY